MCLGRVGMLDGGGGGGGGSGSCGQIRPLVMLKCFLLELLTFLKFFLRVVECRKKKSFGRGGEGGGVMHC